MCKCTPEYMRLEFCGRDDCQRPLDKTDIRQQSHYTQFKIQPVVFIAENNLDFLTGNVIKYVLRHGKKNGVEDLEKAKHYLDMLIQKTKGEEVRP